MGVMIRVGARGEERNECASTSAPQPLAKTTRPTGTSPQASHSLSHRLCLGESRASAAVMTVARVGAEAERVPLARALPLSRVPPQLRG